jgi:small subunit ribosomal protein S6e
MAFKIVIGEKGKAWKLESEAEGLVGKSLGEKVKGEDVDAKLSGYEFQITGGSDISGFPMYSGLDGIGLRKVLLAKGFGMRDSERGIRRKKSVRGKTISNAVVQINVKVVKAGEKKLAEIFPEQNQAKAEEKKEAPKEEVKSEKAE